MYEVKPSNKKFASFFDAIAFAEPLNAEIFEIATGLRRWAPLSKPTAKKMRQYREHAAAYAAQKRMLDAKQGKQ